MIKSVILDLGKVIVPFDFQRAYKGMEARSGVPAEVIRRRLGETDLFRQFESGKISGLNFAHEVSVLLNISIPYDEFIPIWTSIFLPETLISERVIEELRGRARLVLLSNTNVIHFDMLRQSYPLLRHFHATVVSYEVGAMKPDAAIYEHAIRAAECGAAECLFFDDMPENVEAARGCGIQAEVFESEAQLLAVLTRNGISLFD